MPATSKSQFRFFKALENSPKLRKKLGVSKSTAEEYTQSNVNEKRYENLPEKKMAWKKRMEK